MGWSAAAVVIAAIGTYSQMSSAEDAKKNAKKQAELQQQQIAEQKQQAANAARINEIKSARAARIQGARIAASVGGLGAGGDIVNMPLMDLNTSLNTNLDEISKNLTSQNTQFDITSSQKSLEAKMAIDRANATIWKSVIDFGGSVLQSGVLGSMFAPGEYGSNFNEKDTGWQYGPTMETETSFVEYVNNPNNSMYNGEGY